MEHGISFGNSINPQFWIDLVTRLISSGNLGVINGQNKDGSSGRDSSPYYPGTSSDFDPLNPNLDDNGISRPSTDTSSTNYFYNLIDSAVNNHHGNELTALGDNINDQSIQALLSWLSLNQSDIDFKHGAQQDLLKWIQTLNTRDYEQKLRDEQRDYNWKVLQEQRQYDLPQSQLQRFMQTGLSRGGSLELISGSGAGSGSSTSGLIGSPITPGATGMASDYAAAGGTTLRNYTGAVLDIVNSLSSLASLAVGGVNIGTAIKQQHLLDQNLVVGGMQNNAYKSVGQFLGAAYSVAADGTPYLRPGDGDTRNAESLIKWAQGVSKSDNPSLYDYVHSPSFSEFTHNPFAWSVYDQWYGTHTNAAQKNTEEDYMRMSDFLLGQRQLQKINIEQSSQELSRTIRENQYFYKLAGYLNERDILAAQSDIFELAAAQTPDQLALRLDYIKNHNATLAYMSFVELMQTQTGYNIMKGSDLYKNSLGMAYFLDKMGLTDGLISDSMRVSSMGAVGVNSLGQSIVQGVPQLYQEGKEFFSNLDQQVEEGIQNGIDFTKNKVNQYGEFMKDKIQGFKKSFQSFFKSILPDND